MPIQSKAATAKAPVDPSSTPAELRSKLAEIIKSRKAAEKKGAFTAVSSLHKLETDILRALQPPPATSPTAGNPYEDLDDDALLRMVSEMLRAWPDEMVRRVDDLVGARLGRNVMRVVS